MSPRTNLVLRLRELVGADQLEIEDIQSGWPALATVHCDTGPIPIALFVSKVGLTGRKRDEVERRIQNPADSRPLTGIAGRTSVLVGLWEEDHRITVPNPLVVMFDPTPREGHATRWSAFTPLTTLIEALQTGWATHTSDSEEVIRCIFPSLLPAAITADLANVEPDGNLIQIALKTSGLVGEPLNNIVSTVPILKMDRARRAVYSLIRNARFADRVLNAYNKRCAMCGLGLGLVQGAHIYPASAPDSPDEPWNGIALCPNHHLAFDRYLVAIHPYELCIIFHENVLRAAESDASARAFINGTLPRLEESAPDAQPDPAMILRRYGHYSLEYNWLPFQYTQ